MATTSDVKGISRYGDESAAQFSNAGTRYTFFTSEGPQLTDITISASTAGSTTLVQSKSNKTTKITPLNSSVFLAPNKEWANVNAGVTANGQNFVANMTVAAMTNDQKRSMPVSYGAKTFVVSSNSGKNYQLGGTYSHTLFSTYWGHDISWDVRPTAYFSASATTTSKNPHSQALFPRTPSPRWFRRASVQVATHPVYGSRAFFVYTDLLSTFYIYPVVHPKTSLEQYSNTSDWAIPEGKYKKFDVTWGDIVLPTVDTFTNHIPNTYVYLSRFSNVFITWTGDFSQTMSSDYPDPAFDTWMGGKMSGYDSHKNITPNQYLWTFNYNATRATTVAYKKGDVVRGRNVEGGYSDLYKHVGSAFGFPKEINDGMKGLTALAIEPAVAAAPTDKVYDYYPVLMEVSINIKIGKEIDDFTVDFNTVRRDNSQNTGIYYLGSGYTYPTFKNGTTIPTSGDSLAYISMSCYGDFSNYDPSERPQDIYFEKLGDPTADKDLPANFPNTDFVKMMVSGNYDEATIGNFIESIDGFQNYVTLVSTALDNWIGGGNIKYTSTPARTVMNNCASSIAVEYTDLNGIPQVLNINPMQVIAGDASFRKILSYQLRMYGINLYFMIKKTYAIFQDSLSNWFPTRSSASSPLGKLREYLQAQGYNTDWVESKHTFNKEADIVGNVALCVMFFLYTMYQIIFCNVANSPMFLSSGSTKSFDELLKDHCYKYQTLALLYEENSPFLMLLCVNYISKKILNNLNLGDAQRDLLSSLLAQSIYREYSDIEYTNVTEWQSTYYDKLPRISCQIIDGMLMLNSDLSLVSTPSGTYSTNLGTGATDRTQRRFKIDNVPAYSRAIYFLQDNSGLPFGKKINKFKAVLEYRVDDAVKNEFLLLDSPYACLEPASSLCASYPMLYYSQGDKVPYISRLTLIDVIQQADNDWTVLDGYGYQSHVYEQFWLNGGNAEAANRYHTNTVTFGFFLKTNETTKANNLVAMDYPTGSFIFYGAKSNYHYPASYSVGSCLYINGTLEEATGTFLDSNPSTIGTKETKLPIGQFNMIYHYVAARQLQEDITQLQSLYPKDSIMYPNGNAAAPADILPNHYMYIPTAEAKVVDSVLMSHPNGSIAAYSLPPLGFLYLAEKDTAKIKGNYTANMTIDYVKLRVPSTSTTKAPEYIVSTHKEMFNKAFSQGRDYSYYTDVNTDGFMGGFCTAAAFYDFNLPKEFSYLANNYTAP